MHRPHRSLLPLALALALAACGDDDGTAPPDAGGDAPRCARACDDGLFCNGAETCAPTSPEADEAGCVSGTPPCTAPGSTCDEAMGACVGGEGCDMDEDGVDALSCGGLDCDDADPDRYPGNVEVCDADGHDEDCDPTTFGGDEDEDGYAGFDCCNGDACGEDCDDTRAGVNPGASDGCGGGDEDCDGRIDEEPDATFYRDQDDDNYGDDADTLEACSLPSGYAVRGGDCDDDPFDDDPDGVPANEVNPGRTEICNEVDDDCDGVVDVEGCGCFSPGETEPCGLLDPSLEGVGVCTAGVRSCSEDGVLSACVGAVNPTTEVCNDLDDDCDGETDEGTFVICWTDADGDGVPPMGATSSRQCGLTCTPDTTLTDPSTLGAEELDCDDTDATARPGNPELCDGDGDEDCDGTVDEMATCDCTDGAVQTCAEAGFLGACAVGSQTCTDGAWSGCPAPAAEESCGGGDEDCDGLTDEPGALGATPHYVDLDEDGFGTGDPVDRCGEGPRAEGGRWSDTTGDCDDTDDTVYPGATELCDGQRNACGVPGTGFDEDADGDGYAAPDAMCVPGFPKTDCDDVNRARNPNAGYSTEPLCPYGETVQTCDVIRPTQRCIVGARTCPTSCAINEGTRDRVCADGVLCTCTGAPLRCTFGGSCRTCRPTSGETPTGLDTGDPTCDRGYTLCPCPDTAESCAPPDEDCVLEAPEDAVAPASFDRNCDGEETPRPTVVGWECGPSDGTLPEGCTGRLCFSRGEEICTLDCGGAGCDAMGGCPTSAAELPRASCGDDTATYVYETCGPALIDGTEHCLCGNRRLATVGCR